MRKGVHFTDVNGVVRIEKDLRVTGRFRVLGNLRVAGSSVIRGAARLGSKEEVIGSWSPVDCEGEGNPYGMCTTPGNPLIKDADNGLEIHDEVSAVDSVYHFDEGLEILDNGDMLVKGDCLIKGNLDANRVILSGKVSFHRGIDYHVKPRYESQLSTVGKSRNRIGKNFFGDGGAA